MCLAHELGGQVGFVTHADEGELFYWAVGVFGASLLEGAVVETGEQFVEIGAGGDAVDRHDFPETAIAFAIEEVAGG